MPWQQDSGLADILSGLPVRPRPQAVLFAPPTAPDAPDAADGPLPFALPPMPGYHNPGAGLMPDFAPISHPTRDLQPDYASPPTPALAGTNMPAALRPPAAGAPNTPSWDRIREMLGQNIGGRQVSLPQIVNAGVEQHPLDSFAPAAPQDQPSLSRQLYDASRVVGDPHEIAALRNSIISRHNLNRDLANNQQNMGQGLFTNAQREAVGQWGINPLQAGGVQSRLAGAHETTANAQQTHALTGAATLEAALGSAQARQRFMERFPHLPPAQLEQLVAAEEARGGFAPRTLRFPIGATPPATPGVPGAAAAGATPAGASLLSAPAAEVTTPPPIWDALARRIEANPALRRPTPAQGSTHVNDVSPGEFVARLDRTMPGLFASNTPEGRQMREALVPYLNQRFDPTDVAQAQRGVNQFAGLTTTPRAANIATWGGLGQQGAGTGAARLAPLATGRLGALAARANPIAALMSAGTSLPVLWDYGRSVLRGGAMTDDQAGRAMLAQAAAGNWGG